MSVTKVLSLAFAGLIVGLWAYLTVLAALFYRAAIPEQLELTHSFPTRGSDGSCGGAIFSLTDKAALSIETHGRDALNDAVRGRGYLDPSTPRFHQYTYRPWQETPLPRDWTSEGTWAGLHCMGLSANDARTITSAAKAAGSYFTTAAPTTMLLVIPKLRLAVYTYFN